VKTHLDCYPCFLRQALEAARFAGAGERQQEGVVQRALGLLANGVDACNPAEIGDKIHRLVRDEVGHHDPYVAVKESSTRQALSFYPRLKSLLAQANDPLMVAVRLSIVGNIIDYAQERRYDLWSAVERVLVQPFAVDHRKAFREALTRTGQLLFLADNAGETVFDRLLIEALDVPVAYAVKGGPILNDATSTDARAAGIDEVAEIVSTGSDAPGTILARCSPEFRKRYAAAPLVVAKGQANYETLDEEGPEVFFALQVKCPVLARDAGVPVGSIVFKRGAAA
jgi:uncharacterized protein with ATP-grasp and redox domains